MALVKVRDYNWGSWVTLTNPPVNAMGSGLVAEFTQVLEDLVGKQPTIMLLGGEGKCFSAGADLKETQSTSDELLERYRSTRRIEELLQAAPFPIVAAIHGACIGGAMNLIANCDLRVARDDAFFSLPEVKLGRAGGSANLRGLIPEGAVRWLALTGERIDASEALRIHLVDKVFPSDDWPDRLRQLAEQIGGTSREGLYAIKESLNRAQGVPRRDARWMEQQVSYRLWSAGRRQGFDS
jgi:enoyl-CoA hydratase/carnithine racemase